MNTQHTTTVMSVEEMHELDRQSMVREEQRRIMLQKLDAGIIADRMIAGAKVREAAK